ncbi:MAG: NAD(P)H-dependent oxidoreductase subunit E [Synergistetes bacterium]|nr:MAG: NADH dehydrogenase (Quinone) [bacterium 42_11]MBC7331574.1 NAD(P)H-dependent oxidoreductase subunit E [Synergistota bacterium]MDK2871860.1 NADH-quinone oxidoreductase subunit [bacterium]
MNNTKRAKELEEIILKHSSPAGRILSILEEIQEREGYLSKESLKYISKRLNIPLADLYSLVTFYSFFNLERGGKHTITVCMGTACYVKGAPKIIEELERRLGIKEGETTSDGIFTIKSARCFGACSMAPVVRINERIYGYVFPESLPSLLKLYGWKEK